MIAAAQNEEPDESPGGSGGKPRDETGVTKVRSGRMLGRAIRDGWLGPSRWDTDATAESIQPKPGEKLTAKQIAVAAVLRDMMGSDARPRQIAVGNLLKMEQQNQADEHKVMPSQVLLRQEKNPDGMTDDDLLAIIDGRFTGGSSGGAIQPPSGEEEPA